MPTVSDLYRCIESREYLKHFEGPCSRVDWYDDEPNGMTVYIRLGKVFLPQERIFVGAVTVANVSVLERGKGVFTRFLDKLESIVSCPIYVEQILNARLDSFLERRGYVLVHDVKDRTLFEYRTFYGGTHRIKFNQEKSND